MTRSFAAAVAAGLLATPGAAFAQTSTPNLGSGLADIAVGQRASASTDAGQEPWGPVPSPELSIANLVPMLYAFVNNGPVFGLPGTVGGDVLHRTQLTGDWGGVRTDLARHGVFIDGYTTLASQDITAGGLATGSTFIANTQLSFNLDTGRAGWWPGGLLHVTLQNRTGDEPAKTLTSGASVPSYVGLVLPEPTHDDRVAVSEFYVTQALGKTFGVIAGKISDIYIPDQTAFANSSRYYFSNFNFNKNPMTPNFYQPTALAVLAAWKPNDVLAVAGGVLDTNSQSDNFAKDAFKYQNYYLTSIVSYRLGDLPGQFMPAFNWSNQPQLDLAQPFGALRAAQVPQAIGVLVGSPETQGLPLRNKDESWFAIANLSQFLWTPHTPEETAYRLRTGQPLRGVGLIARIGAAPERTNTVTRDASAAIFARGVFDARPEDSFGAGFYYNAISDDLKDSVSRLSAGHLKVADERGAEVFYHLALTPAVRFIVSYQHIWDPLTARIATDARHTDILTTRLTWAW